MIKNILEFLELSAINHPDKSAFIDEAESMTYTEFLTAAKSVGSSLLCLNERNKPVAILMKKSAACLACMMGVAYSGNFYVVVDSNAPAERINKIFSSLSPVAVLTDKENSETISMVNFDVRTFFYEDAKNCPVNHAGLSAIRKRQIDTDPLYALFTSGSTGMPKGTVVCHRSVIDYAEWVTETFDITSETIFGNQSPFYFSMSVLDIFSTIKNAATLHIIPKTMFSFPLKLLDYIVEKEINTLYWVPSALSIVANWKALDYVELPKLKKVLFAGEVMPMKQLNEWRKHLPEAVYANLYGPTEITDICTYYVVNRAFDNSENLPIGNACNNCDVFLLKEDGTLAGPEEEGELCVRGSFLGLGYYNNSEKTQEVFVQNPLNPNYPELIYKTGDIVRYNEYGELVYITRNDFQIKRMGYRIELGEIEAAINSTNGVNACACIYEKETDTLNLFYNGHHVDDDLILAAAKDKLPPYMLPNKVICVMQMPYNANGKIDRLSLKNTLQNK
ncbi:MAG: amino acid adenylation domain-containing protein [Eubacteriales bacterium]